MLSRKTKRILEWTSIGLICVLALSFGFMLSYQQAYAGRIYRNVYFGTLDLSGVNKKDASKRLQNNFKTLMNEEFTISAGDKSLKAKLSDTGITFDSKEIVEKLYSAGRSDSFWDNIKGSSKTLFAKTMIQGKPTVNQTAFDNFVEITVKQLNNDSRDASLAISEGAINEVSNIDGQTVNTENLAQMIMDMISNGSRKIELERDIKPARVTSLDFAPAKQQAEQYLNTKIIFVRAGQNSEPTKKEIGSWIVFSNDAGKYRASFDQSNIKAYLNRIAKGFEIQRIDKKVDNDGNILQDGRDGFYLDKDNATASLLKQIGQPEIRVELATYTETFKEIKVSVSSGVETGRFEGKYLDINLSTQRFCRVEGTKLVDCLMTSTGKPSMPTPTGTYNIMAKIPMAFSSIYGLYMPWWQQFSGPYGIHELVVFPDGRHEVVDHLGQTVSHGCVRLGPGTAEMVYNWTEIGTPVYIHK